MNYEQKYKEALKVIENLYNIVKYQSSSDALLITQTIEKSFPELCESEDEKIRKALLEYFREQCGMSNWNGVYGYEVYAWLEKQGEQKPTDKVESKQEWSEEDKKYIAHIIAALESWDREHFSSIPSVIPKCIDWLKYLKPNNWKPSEEQLEAFEHFVRSIGESGYVSPYDNNTKLICSLLNDLKNI